MKICIALHSCMDLGGIINHTEQLIGGLKDIGHEVVLRELIYSTRANASNKTGDWITGPSGIPHDQGKGWQFGSRDKIAYKGPLATSARQVLSEFDIVIWTVPVPSKSKNNLGNSFWPTLYDLPKTTKQIAFIHDGNARRNSSHIMAIEHHLSGIACVHPCALNGSDFISVPRALILNPQENPVRYRREWRDKFPGFVNMQTFKAWKRVHELLEAIAYMPDKSGQELREVAGKGIEYQYLTSEEKCKPAYHHDDTGEWFSHYRFWDAAVANGMTHHNYWNVYDVDTWLSRARVLVDPSWSDAYSKNGGHFNRVVVDAMIRGAIPVARRQGMGEELFISGQHYVEIPKHASPQEYADIILETGNMSSEKAYEMQMEGKQLLHRFDRKRIAQDVIDLALEQHPSTVMGQHDPTLSAKASDFCFNHFGVLF